MTAVLRWTAIVLAGLRIAPREAPRSTLLGTFDPQDRSVILTAR
jgi:hypothetical protein